MCEDLEPCLQERSDNMMHDLAIMFSSGSAFDNSFAHSSQQFLSVEALLLMWQRFPVATVVLGVVGAVGLGWFVVNRVREAHRAGEASASEVVARD